MKGPRETKIGRLVGLRLTPTVNLDNVHTILVNVSWTPKRSDVHVRDQ